MASSTAKVARAQTVVAAPAATCWKAWTQPGSLISWYPERVEGELVEGGEVTFAWDSLGQSIALEVAEARAPQRLRLRGRPPNRPPQEQEVRIRDRGSSSEVEILHSGFRAGPGGEDERSGSEAGWRSALEMLRLYLERYSGRTRASVAALGTAATDLKSAYKELARQAGLGEDPASGASQKLAIGGAAGARSEVLVAAFPYQILLWLPKLEAAMTLRTFSVGAADQPGSAILAAQLWSWNETPGAADALRPSVDACLERTIAALGGPSADA